MAIFPYSTGNPFYMLIQVLESDVEDKNAKKSGREEAFSQIIGEKTEI